MDEPPDIPAELLEPPEGELPNPPVESRLQLLPFDQLLWENFERLCLRVVRLESELKGARLFGTRGQLQAGIDIYSALPSGKYVTYQCKRYSDVTAGDIKEAVTRFTKGRWARSSSKFVFCTSASAVRTQLALEIETQTKRLRKRASPIEFEVWDAEELSAKLKNQGPIVEDFFGPSWVRAFVGELEPRPAEPSELEQRLSNLLDSVEARTQFISHDWAPHRMKEQLSRLQGSHPGLLAKLNDEYGSPPMAESVATTIRRPPSWLTAADVQIWDLLGRTAEVSGEWDASSIAWKRVADLTDDPYSEAGALVSAAVAARVSDRTDPRYDRYLEAAAQLAPHHPRLVLELLPVDASADERLEAMADLAPQEPDEQALVAAQRALAYVLKPDPARAREYLAEVKRHIPDAAVVDGLEISITVQEGRLAVMEHRPLSLAALRKACTSAEALRDRLRNQRRFLEATRMVMLAADIQALLGKRKRAAAILGSASEEERATTEQKEVLAASAVGRALDYSLALELIDGADDTPHARLIRFEALAEVGTPTQRDDALRGLDELMEESGPVAPEAAFALLADTLGGRPIPWNEKAAVFLRSSGYERAAVSAEALYRVKTEGYGAVQRLLKPYGRTSWALVAMLRAAISPNASRESAVLAADAVLELGLAPFVRIDAAAGLAKGGEYSRARQVLAPIARDASVPDSTRCDAYSMLMSVVGNDQKDWEFAAKLYDEWVALDPADHRSNKWAPRIANRRPRTGD